MFLPRLPLIPSGQVIDTPLFEVWMSKGIQWVDYCNAVLKCIACFVLVGRIEALPQTRRMPGEVHQMSRQYAKLQRMIIVVDRDAQPYMAQDGHRPSLAASLYQPEPTKPSKLMTMPGLPCPHSEAVKILASKRCKMN